MFEREANCLKIDLADVSSREELHALMAAAFSFPDYYGRNWDAFDECIRDISLPKEVKIYNLEALRTRLSREAELLSQCIQSFAAESSRRNVRIMTANNSLQADRER